MTTLPDVSIFPTRSRDGKALYEAVLNIVRDLGFSLNQLPSDPTALDYASACQNADVVILDATIEPKGQHNYHISYPHRLTMCWLSAARCSRSTSTAYGIVLWSSATGSWVGHVRR